METGFLSSFRAKLARVPDAKLLAGLFIFALVLRLTYLMGVAQTDVFKTLVGDGHVYDLWAQEIQKDWFGKEVFYQAPLYPYFLAATYTIFGHDLLMVRLIQVTLGSAACVLLALAGRSFFSRNTGLLAGLLLAVYAPAIFFDGLVQKASLDLFFMTLLLFFLGKIPGDSRRRWPLLAGIVLGCLALTRENALALFPIIFVWLVWLFWGKGLQQSLSMGMFFLLGMAFVLMPVAARNYKVGGEFFITTSQFGPNFYIGNNEKADGKYRPLRWGHGSALLERKDATEMAEKTLGRRLSPGEVSSFWSRQAFEWIDSHPADWLKLMGRKWLLVWNDREIPDSDEPLVYEDASLVLALLGFVFSFGTIAALAAAGVVATWPERRRLAVLYAMALGIAASVALFYVFARYRFAMVPILVLFAAAGVLGIIRLAGNVQPARLVACALLVVATGWIARWNLEPDNNNPRAMAYYNLAVSLDRQNSPDLAIAYYERSLDSKPDYVQAHINIGILLANQGRLDEAINHYMVSLRIKPNNSVAFNNLGNALSARGNLDDAALWMSKAIEVEPDNAVFHNNLGRIFSKQGKFSDAEIEYRRALALQPGLPQAEAGLNNVLRLKKDPHGKKKKE